MPPARVGRAEARLWTRPLRKLTPRTSKGFEVAEFARNVLGIELMPWQRWLLIHALELLPDGRYRFQYVFVFVSRQNGKTTLLAVLALWRLLVDGARLVLGTSTNLDYARESWEQAVSFAKDSDYAAPEFVWPERRTNGEQTLTTTTSYPDPDGSGEQLKRKPGRYKIAAATRRGGRSLSVDLGIADELREHADDEAWAALTGTTTARPDGQVWALSNMGDDSSTVLNYYRDMLVLEDPATGAETVVDVHRHAIFEWSGPPGCAFDDWSAIAQANPALGHTIDVDTMRGKMLLKPAVYRTEHLCQRVRKLEVVVDMTAWRDAGDDQARMDKARARPSLVLETTREREHTTLVAAAAIDDERVQVEVVAAWPTLAAALNDLPALLERIRPRHFGWLPGGPAAGAAPDLRKVRGVRKRELKGEVHAICQSFVELVGSRRVVHNNDPLLAAQLAGVQKEGPADRWRFGRANGNSDAALAAAGAAWLVRTEPSSGKPRVVVARPRQAEHAEKPPGKRLLTA